VLKKDLISRNIPVSYIFTFFGNLSFTHGVWMIFLFSRGYSLTQLGILEGFFHVTTFMMEVPTGAVADLWGRKVSRIAGRLFFFASLLLMYYGPGLFTQIIGFAVCAIGYNLESGAGEALLYDSLKQLGREDQFMKINGRLELILQTAFIFSFLGGGYLAVKDYGLLFLFSGIVVLLSVFSALFLTEPVIGRKNHPGDEKNAEDAPVNSSLGARVILSVAGQTRDAFTILRKTPSLFALIVFVELIFTFVTILFFFLQTYWKASGFSEWDIGLVFAFQCGLSGITGLFASRVEKKLGPRGILLFMPLLLVLVLWGVALTPWSRLFFISTGLLEGVIIIAVSDYINRKIPSKTRATVLSFQSMIFSAFMILLFPLVGLVGDQFSLNTAFILLALTGTAVYLVYQYFFRRVNREGAVLPEQEDESLKVP
jgi:MFS family permease